MPWRPPWTGLVQWFDWRLNHPYWHRWDGEPGTHWGPLSARLCALFDYLTNNWCHD